MQVLSCEQHLVTFSKRMVAALLIRPPGHGFLCALQMTPRVIECSAQLAHKCVGLAAQVRPPPQVEERRRCAGVLARLARHSCVRPGCQFNHLTVSRLRHSEATSAFLQCAAAVCAHGAVG